MRGRAAGLRELGRHCPEAACEEQVDIAYRGSANLGFEPRIALLCVE